MVAAYLYFRRQPFEDADIPVLDERRLAVHGVGKHVQLTAPGFNNALKAQAHAEDGQAALRGMVLIAPAPDFTEELMWKQFSPEIRRELETTGRWMRPSDYGDPYPITRALIEGGRKHLLLGGSIDTGCPVRILQGAQDPDVPWQHAFALTHCLPSDDVVLTLIQDGDHRLSRPQDIARMIAAGSFPVEKVITARIDARDVVAKGFEALLNPTGEHLKILVTT